MNWDLKREIIEKYKYQWKFAEHMGVQESFVSRVVNDRHNLSDENKNIWAKALDVSVDEIF